MRNASVIDAEETEMPRSTPPSKLKAPPRLGMLRSKMAPTTCPPASMAGEPELRGMMSLSVCTESESHEAYRFPQQREFRNTLMRDS